MFNQWLDPMGYIMSFMELHEGRGGRIGYRAPASKKYKQKRKAKKRNLKR